MGKEKQYEKVFDKFTSLRWHSYNIYVKSNGKPSFTNTISYETCNDI